MLTKYVNKQYCALLIRDLHGKAPSTPRHDHLCVIISNGTIPHTIRVGLWENLPYKN